MISKTPATSSKLRKILLRDAMHSAAYAVVRCPFAVYLARSYIVSKRTNVFSSFFHLPVYPPL